MYHTDYVLYHGFLDTSQEEHLNTTCKETQKSRRGRRFQVYKEHEFDTVGGVL